MNSHPASQLARRLLRTRPSPLFRPLGPRIVSPNASIPRPRWAHGSAAPRKQSSRLATILLVAGVSGFALASAYRSPVSFDAVAADHSAHLMEEAPSDTTAPDPKQQQQHQDSDLPQYRLSEIRKHDANSDTPWVIHGNKVYDITDWIPGHPGGQVILRAAGGSIEPYWDIFTIHKSDYVYEILSQYQIGYVHPADLVDGKPAQDAIEDPFANDPIRDPSFTVHTAKPRNAEPPEEALDEHFMTPNHLFYIRNHMWVPKVENGGDDHVLTIELPDGSNKEYTLKELKAKFPSHTVAAALQCSGNRRRHMSEGSGRKANGLPWTVGAISNATWEGVYLSDILNDAGFDVASARNGTSEAKHIHFGGLEAYSASIPIKKAVDPQGDVLLAYSMNGEPLPRDHGFPLRAIVPGHVAARSVKWLSQITLSDEESPSQWQRRDYKCFGPNQTQVDWDSAPAIQELPVQSAITSIKLGKATPPPNAQQSASSPEARTISVGGYAYSGGGRAIIRVDVSLDDGKTWDQAYLLPDCQAADGSPSPCLGNAHWTWKRWRYEGTLPASALQSQSSSDADAGKRCTQVVVKATDEVYNTQPETHAATWNVRGNLATAWHRVKVCADCKPTPTSKGVEKTASRE